MLKNVADITSEGKQTGLNTQANILGIDKSQSPDMMDVIVNFDGSLEKRLGTNTQNAVIIANSAAAGFSPTGSITSNLIAYWKLDEASGNRFDSIGGHILQDGNGVLQSGGIKNQAASFVASDSQYLLHQNTSTLATGDVDFSMSTWVYRNSTSLTLEQTIISKRDLSQGTDLNLLLHYDGSFTDSSISPKTVTPNGQAAIDNSIFKFGTGSAKFDGSGDFLNISSVWNPGAGDFYFGTWVRWSSVSGTQNIISFDNTRFAVGLTGTNNVFVFILGLIYQFAFSPSVDTWYYLEFSRSGSSIRAFIDGAQIGTTQSDSQDINAITTIHIGDNTLGSGEFSGWLDDTVFITGRSVVTANHASPTAPFLNPSIASQFEYFLYINTDNLATFEVSSSGSAQNGRVSASSFGALGTGTWYNIVAWHDTGNFIGVSVNLAFNSAAYALGLKEGSAPFALGAISNGASRFFDGRIDETSFYKKVLTASDRVLIYNTGNANTFSAAFDNKPWASFDFGANTVRWLTVAAGTGVYASSNLGLSWVMIASDRTATYQYFERSKNVLVATSDFYDTPLAWPGSANTFMVRLNSNAPLAKYSVNFQGFLILLNTQARRRGFFYQDENTQLTGTWASSFDIPSSQDDEITATFILRRYLYVSTRYYLYRLSYVGGNPDFSYTKIKDWGYVSRTVKEIYVEGVGQVVMGLCWDGKMRLFDGSDDQIASDPVEQDNGLCEFALDNLSYTGSGPIVSFSEVDYNQNVYKLCVAIGADSMQTTHMLNYDGRGKSFYPYARQHYNTMTRAESAGKIFVMAFDRSGYCHMLDSGNLDGNTSPVNEHYDSAYIFEKSPAQNQKGHQTHLFFGNRTSGTLHCLDRVNFDNDYKLRETFIISGSDRKSQIHKVIDVPESYNVYQWRLTSSAGTTDPWLLQRYDHFLSGKGIGKED